MYGIRGRIRLNRSIRIIAIMAVILLIGTAFQSLIFEVVSADPMLPQDDDENAIVQPIDLRSLVIELINATGDLTDSDGDGLPDSVEFVIGTDPTNTDSDFDRLDDYYEALNNLDPMRPDSNRDGLPDYFEVTDVPLDMDNDLLPNAWDPDNDGDGVGDAVDVSPFSKTSGYETFHFEISTNGNPTYINFQVRPENADLLKLPLQYFNWPYDRLGVMKDKDNSLDDLQVSPTLELTGIEYYWIVSKSADMCVEVTGSSTSDGADIDLGLQDDADNMLWLLGSLGNGYYKIVARHSGKCLQVDQSSQLNGATVSQGTYTGASNQQWKLQQMDDGYYSLLAKHSRKYLTAGNGTVVDPMDAYQWSDTDSNDQLWDLKSLGLFIPDQSDISDYGVGVGLNKITIPLFPVIEYGATVALGGRMFYPASDPMDISVNGKLVWNVNGKTDTTPIAAFLGVNGKYLSADQNGLLRSDGNYGDESVSFDWIDRTGEDSDPGGNYFALRTQGGKYVSVKTDGRLVADADYIGDMEKFWGIPLKWIGVDKMVMKAPNGKFVSVHADGTVLADRDSVEGVNTDPISLPVADVVKFKVYTVGYQHEMVPLARYPSDFLLTGLSVEENYGSDVGIFYHEDAGQTILAGFAVSYGFLRNSTTNLSDLPQLLYDHDLYLQYDIRSFAHSHQALLNLTSDMIHGAIESLPPGYRYPILTAFEDHAAAMNMDKTYNTSSGGSIAIDVSAEPVSVTKTLRMGWYDVDTKELLEVDEVVNEINAWSLAQGYDSDTTATLQSMSIVWDAGESTLIRIGADIYVFDAPESPDVFTYIDDYALTGVGFLCDLVKGANAVYRFIKLAPSGGVSKAALSGAQVAVKDVCSAKLGFLGKIGRLQAALDIIGWVVTGVIAFYAFMSIAIELGGDFGLYVGGLYAMIIVVYAAVLFILGMCGPAGAILALVIALDALISELCDIKLPFSFMFDFWMAAIFELVTDTRIRSEVDLSVGDSSVDIYDLDDNGLDVGDKIEYRSRIISTVTATEYGTLQDLQESYLKPTYHLAVPSGTNSTNYSYRNTVSVSTDYTTYMATEYETGIWVKPGIGMVNYPVVAWLSVDYKVFYDNGYWAFGWHWERESSTGSSEGDKSTIHFDIMPGSLEDFLGWGAVEIVDHDWDGLRDGDEDPFRSNPYIWDTDGDGLNDKYESEIGSDPVKPDTDQDGLRDLAELQHGTDPNDVDTDDDGLLDGIEVFGWMIEFNYSGTRFYWRVFSDPLLADEDGDGLNDQMEYWSGLNPKSGDTDGDGVMDVESPRLIPAIEFVKKWGSEGSALGQFNESRGIALDSSGNVYIADAANSRIQKFDSEGNFITSWGSFGTGNGQFFYPFGIDVSPAGYVYVADTMNQRIQVFTSDGVFVTKWGSPSAIGPYPNPYSPAGTFAYPWDVAVDNSGYVYVADQYNARIQKFNAVGVYVTMWAISDPYGFFGMPQVVEADDNGYIYVTDITDNRIQKFNLNGVFVRDIYGYGTEFSVPYGLAVDSEGSIYVANENHTGINKYDPNGIFLNSAELTGPVDGQYGGVWGIVVDPNGDIFVTDAKNYCVEKFEQILRFDPPDPPPEITDADGEGLEDVFENAGWSIQVTNSTGTWTVAVTSDPSLPDTDLDGLTDLQEYNLSSNPRSLDTDGDGLNDLFEWKIGTNVSNCDTDGDGLSDGQEFSFRTDPREADTDGDGLSDYEEFLLGSNPRSPDTDGDGLNDSYERDLNTSLTNPDTDEDVLFDGEEIRIGTDPNDPDCDYDGLSDGYEVILGTDPKNNDTDGDGILDGEEITRHMNPLSNDTDGDGLLDAEELELGTDPTRSDSDGDGVSDSNDTDSKQQLMDEVVVCYDLGPNVNELVENLSRYATLREVTPSELLANETGSNLIVLIGRPTAGNDSAGDIMHDLLIYDTELLDKMLTSDKSVTAVRYGVWADTQTVVMISNPSPEDFYKVIEILKSKNVTVTDGTYLAEYATPKSFILIENMDIVRSTGSRLTIAFEEPLIPVVEISRYNASTTPETLDNTSGLLPYEKVMGQYLEIEIEDRAQNVTGDFVHAAQIRIYYTLNDLDRTGDGDADDLDDLNESTLGIYVFNISTGSWTKLTEELDWVHAVGVNTTDIELFGNSYAGYVWAEVSHLSLYGVAGLTYNRPPDVSNAIPSIEIIWSPNHKFVEISILGVTDPDGDEVTITITKITSDEQTAWGRRDGGIFHAPDAYGVGTDSAYLRAESSKAGNGRVYEITFIASDGRGGESIGTVQVYVPHDKRWGIFSPVIDDGQIYDATTLN